MASIPSVPKRRAGLIGSLFGWGDNDIYQSLRDPIRDLGYGLTKGKNLGDAFGAATERGQQMEPYRAEQQQRAEEMAQAAEEKNQTLNWLQSNAPKYYGAVKAGVLSPSEAYNQARIDSQPKAGPEPTANMRDYQFAQQNPGYADFLNPAKPPDYPTSYDEFKMGQNDPAYAESLKPPPKAAGPLSVTAQKELFEAEEAATAGQYVLSALDQAMSLNSSAYDGPQADLRGDTTALFGNQEGIATSQLKNVTTELALSQLKTIFGGMPTEGERKILIEMQGSVNQPRAVREAIYKRAKEMAQRRIEDNKRKAASIRSGDFFDEGYSGTPQAGGSLTYNPATGELE